MFTGIIEETGTLRQVRPGAVSATVVIGAEKVLKDVRTGDSIAVNGVCLTVTRFSPAWFEADVMAETLRCSALGTLRPGSRVNLERAMAADGRFGGHIVTGHIDGTGTVSRIQREGNAIRVTISAPAELMELMVEKGSVAVDGISLTIAALEKEAFTVSLIPHTRGETTLAEKTVGSPVNLENDCIGKYVKRLLEGR